MEYYEALVPAVLSAILSFVVFKFNTGLTIGGLYHFAAIPKLTLSHLGEGALLGGVGALVALIFVGVFRGIGYLSQFQGPISTAQFDISALAIY